MIRLAQIRRRHSVTYSLQAKTVSEVHGELLHLDDKGCGIWRLNRKTQIHMQIPGVHNIRNALAASSVGLHFGLSQNEIKSALESYSAYDKRMQIIKNGHTSIINDTYNANPDSFLPALETLNHLAGSSGHRKIVVVGDMLELGAKSQILHHELFQLFIKLGIAAVFSIGPACKATTDLLKNQSDTSFYSFSSHEDLAGKLKDYINAGDVILLKGSRGMQMEKVLAFL
jgi:UDP-N-acetylmuramoyl-tripeptide--D-alanyl-D-alanine ligase